LGDYSVLEAYFRIKPAPNRTIYIFALMGAYADTAPFVTTKYGANLELSNGISMEMVRGGVPIQDMFDGAPIYTNRDWRALADRYEVDDFSQGSSSASLLWHSVPNFGGPFILRGSLADELRMTFHDDFSGLSSHRFMIRGRIV